MEPGGNDEAAGIAVSRLVGVYQANGTLWGELSYWFKARVGGAHCALCDITHGSVREKPEWRACTSRLAVPFETVHLDERDDEVRAFTEGRTPCVVADTAEGLVFLVDDTSLRACEGSPAQLLATIEAAAADHGLDLG